MQKGVIKFQAPFEKIKELQCKDEAKLYKSIILQAMIDASNNSDSMAAKKLEKNAKNWIFNDSDWFFEVCEKAELEVDFVRKIAKQVIRSNQSTEALFKTD